MMIIINAFETTDDLYVISDQEYKWRSHFLPQYFNNSDPRIDAL